MTPEEKIGCYETLKHIQKVRDNINKIVAELLDRGSVHDLSKMETPEVELFAKADSLGQIEYGSEEYKQSLEDLRPAIEHHYSKNSHHPEFFPNGMSDMNLCDLIELFADWKAATERNKNGNLRKSITHNANKYNIPPMLVSILENSVNLLE